MISGTGEAEELVGRAQGWLAARWAPLAGASTRARPARGGDSGYSHDQFGLLMLTGPLTGIALARAML